MSDFVTWLSQTSFSGALRFDPYPFPLLIITHVVTLALFGGVVVMGNLRVLGLVLTGVPVSRVLSQFRPWKWTGFGILLVTGILLTLSDPVEYYTNIMYWISLLVILLAGVNAAVFHFGVYRTVAEWDEITVAPKSARGWAVRSLIIWVSLVLIGRAIAFF
jgi:hypothetical protein